VERGPKRDWRKNGPFRTDTLGESGNRVLDYKGEEDRLKAVFLNNIREEEPGEGHMGERTSKKWAKGSA